MSKQDDCPLCGGTGEVSISKDGTHEGTDYYGCPVCISRERDEEEARLRAANIDCVNHFNALMAERNELLAALQQISDYARKDGDLIAQHLAGIARTAIAKATGANT